MESWNGHSFQWSLAGNTRGFGNLTTGQRFFVDDFNGDDQTEVMFYSPGDHNWWLGSFSGTQLIWRLDGNTAGFGNLADGRPMWSGDFLGKRRAGMLFYYPGDHNWWVGYSNGSSLQWSLVGNTAGFGNVADGRPIYTGMFSTLAQDDIGFFSPGDNNWWWGSMASGQLQWELAGNTSGFGSGFPAKVHSNTLTGNISSTLTQLLYFSTFDKHVWLGSVTDQKLVWALVDEPTPLAPTNLRITSATPVQVSLDWNNQNNAGDVTISTKVERKLQGGAYAEIYSLPSNATQVTDSDTARKRILLPHSHSIRFR